MALTPGKPHQDRCPFPPINNTLYHQYLDGLQQIQRGSSVARALISQEVINEATRVFTHWNRQVSSEALAEYVQKRCEVGKIALEVLLQRRKSLAPVVDFKIPDEASYQSPEERVRAGTHTAITCREASDFLKVVERDPTIILAFQILQSFVGDYIQQLSTEAPDAHAAMIFSNLADHYRRAANFLRAIPISIYLSGSPEERRSLTSHGLNAAAAKRGLQYLQRLKMFSAKGRELFPKAVQYMPEIDRVFTCPAEPFLLKLFGETDALETVVGFIGNSLQGKIIPQVIVDAGVDLESRSRIIAAPRAMWFVKEYTSARFQLLATYLKPHQQGVWEHLAQNEDYQRLMSLLSDAVTVNIMTDASNGSSSSGKGRLD